MPSVQDLIQQYHAARRAGALFDGFRRGILSVRGKDRVRFLHNLMSHDIKGLHPGQGRPACLLDRQGKILFAATVHARPEELLLEMDLPSLPTARQQLERYHISEAVEFSDATGRYSILPLYGPMVPRLLQKLWPHLDPPEQNLSHTPMAPESGVPLVSRWDLFHLPGFHLWIHPDHVEGMRARILAEGKSLGMGEGSPELFHTLRIEAGVPWPGSELNETVILNELGTEEYVSFTKGCFVGQEIVARIKYRAHPPRLLTGFLLEAQSPPVPGSPIQLGSETVGIITSSCLSPELQHPIALGFLRYGLGTSQLTVKGPSGEMKATVCKLPFAPSGNLH